MHTILSFIRKLATSLLTAVVVAERKQLPRLPKRRHLMRAGRVVAVEFPPLPAQPTFWILVPLTRRQIKGLRRNRGLKRRRRRKRAVTLRFPH